MTNTVIFDIGGVLVPDKTDAINKAVAHSAGISLEKLVELLNQLKEDIIKGILSLLEGYSIVASSLPNYVDHNRLLKNHLYAYSYHNQIFPQVQSLIFQFRKNYRVIGLTNTETEIAEHNERNGLYDNFHKVYTSTGLGLMKPQREIYLAMLEKEKITSQEALFIDDKLANVKGALAVGIPSILYIGFTDLVEQLKQKGIV